MKFLKKYILTFISGIILASLFYLFNSLIPGINSTINVIRIVASGVYFSFYLLLIRVIDDIHDYPTDIINKKNVFKIKTLYALLILFLVILLTISIISSLGYKYLVIYNLLFIIPAVLMIINLRLDNEIITLSYLPLLGLIYPIIINDTFNIFCFIIPFLCSTIIEIIFATIKYKKNKKIKDISLIGGKGYNLERLRMKNTPKYIILPTDFLFPNFDEDKINEVINTFCRNNKLYAVRSSAVDEDSTYSFAGIHDTFLNVNKDNIKDAIIKVVESSKSIRAIEYRKMNNLDLDNIKIAVIIQEMVHADYAGVIFTINPVTNNMSQKIISVTKGLGDKLVDGSVSGTTYTISSNEKKIDGEDILPDKLIKSLMKMTEGIIKKSDRFQDIEFAIKNNKVYFLQARQITTYNNINPHKMTLLIDNSNIIESYYGITSPLTFSFALYIYERVYTETLSLGISKKKINELKPYLSNMLYYYDGKIYYNMKSWYKVTSTLPSKNSLRYMESMMGVKANSNDFKRVKLGLINLIHVGIGLLKRIKNMDSLSEDFIKKFNSIILPYYGQEMNLSNDELIDLYKDIDKKIIKEFTTPIFNDVCVMFNFGKLKEKLKNHPDKDKILAKAINNGGSVESKENATLFDELIKYIKNNEILLNDFKNLNKYELMNKYLNDNSHFGELLNNYIYRFGSRVMNELKLETKTMIEDKTILFEYLKNSLDNKEDNNVLNDDVEIPHNLNKLASKTRYYIKNRERLRLKRTYVFSVIRNIFLNLGRNFKNEGRINDVDDIFYLKVDEIFKKRNDYKNLINERKLIEEEYKNKEYYDRIAFYDDNILPISFKEKDGSLKGIPSGNGIVKARVSYLSSSNDEMIPGNIILAKRTDPGWISLFPLASGLIVEHGSMLSHSFVVAREMGLPAVVGVVGATNIIKDKDIVTLDAETGVVIVEKD